MSGAQRTTLSAGSSSPTVTAAGNLGASRTLAMSTATAQWLTGTLNANHALTITPAAGGRARLFLTQDGTGGRTLTISDGVTPTAVTINPTAGALTVISVDSPDGTTLNVVVESGASPVEGVNVVATSGATQTLPDVTTATIHRVTLTANCTFTFPAAAAGKSFTLVLVQDATGSRTATWPGSVLWPGGTTPTLTTAATKRDVFSFVCADGTNWLGFTAGQNF